MVINSDEDPNETPLSALGTKSNKILGSLNSTKVLTSENDIYRDWRGVAYLAGVSKLCEDLCLCMNAENPITKVIQLWCANKGRYLTANFDNLLKILGEIDRWDVADDLMESLAEDANSYQNQLSIARQKASAACNAFDNDVCRNSTPESDENILTDADSTNHSMGLPPQRYDAYVLFADEDFEFALELIRNLEKNDPNFGFKLCYKDRDLLAGAIESEAIMRLIRERCDRLIVIFSEAFLKSPSNKFFTSFAAALQIEQRRRKIIPCLIEDCTLPITVDFFTNLKYYASGRTFFWDRLSRSIRNYDPPMPSLSIQIEEVKDEDSQKAITSGAPVEIPREKSSKILDPIEPLDSIAVYENNDNSYSEYKLSSVGSCDANASSQKSIICDKWKWYTLLLPSRRRAGSESLSKKEKRKKKYITSDAI